MCQANSRLGRVANIVRDCLVPAGFFLLMANIKSFLRLNYLSNDSYADSYVQGNQVSGEMDFGIKSKHPVKYGGSTFCLFTDYLENVTLW